MKLLIEHIESNFKKPHIIYINKELNEFNSLMDNNDLYKYVKDRYNNTKKNFLFIDEIQEIKNFEKALQNLQAEEIFDIYCTGSNAFMLSGELATLLSGRYIEIKIYGLSYKEFLEFNKLQSNDDSLSLYLKYGGLPYLIHLEFDDDIIYNYLINIYDTIILKDVVKRYKIRNVDFLQRLIYYIADNVGNILSAKKISDFLKSQRIKISPNIVLDYLDHTFVCMSLHSYSGNLANELKKVKKFYLYDNGIRNSLLNDFSTISKRNDRGVILERAVEKLHRRVDQGLCDPFISSLNL